MTEERRNSFEDLTNFHSVDTYDTNLLFKATPITYECATLAVKIDLRQVYFFA